MDPGVSAHPFCHLSSWIHLRQESKGSCGDVGVSACGSVRGCQSVNTAFNPSRVAHSRAVSVHIQIASSSQEWPVSVPLGNLLPRDAPRVPGQILKQQVKWVC